MIKGFLGTKQGQLQQFTADGRRIPVTTIQAGPCWVTNILTAPTCKKIQLGFGEQKHSHKAQDGIIKKAGLTQKLRFLREFAVPNDDADMTVGKQIAVTDVFAEGDTVRVIGISKGKGFSGVVKRHGFKGGPRTHGQSDKERAPGSIGQTTTPGRVYKGKRMAGRQGSDRVTVKGLKIVSIDGQNNQLVVKGLVPGGVGGLLIIQKEA